MASERKVWWKALADFSQVRNEASRTSRSLEELEDRQESLGNTSEESGEKISSANESVAKSRKTDTKAAKPQAKASRDVADAHGKEEKIVTDLRASMERLTEIRERATRRTTEQIKSYDDLIDAYEGEVKTTSGMRKAFQRLADVRKEMRKATDEQSEASMALTAAQQAEKVATDRLTSSNQRAEQSRLRVTSAEQAAERAAKALTKAQKALTEAQDKGTDGAEDLAKAQGKVEDAQARVARTTLDLERARLSLNTSTERTSRVEAELATATERVHTAMVDAESGSGGFGNTLRTLTSRMFGASRASTMLSTSLTTLKVAAIGAGIGHLVAAVGALGAGLTAVGGAIGPVFTSLSSLPAILTGAVTGIGVVIAGFSGIGEALKASGEDAEKFAEAMEGLSPPARQFVRYLVSIKDEMKTLKDVAQAGLLPGVEEGIRNLMPLLPMIRKNISDMAKILGDGFADLTDTVASRESTNMMDALFGSNERATRDLTAALSPLYMAITRVAYAARPLTEWFAELVLTFGEWADATSEASLANGGLAAAMDRARASIGLVGDVLGNFFEVLINLGRGGYDSGMNLLGMFNDWLEAWADFTGSAEGQNKLKKYFADAEPTFIAIAKLLGRIGRLFADLATNDQTAAIFDKLAGPGMDAVQRILDVFTDSEIGAGLVDSLIGIADAFATLLENGGGDVLASFANGVAAIVEAFAGLVKIPGVAGTLTALAAAVGAFKGATILGKVTGTTALVKGGTSAYKKTRQRRIDEGGDGGMFFSGGGREERRKRRTSGGKGGKMRGLKGGGAVGGLAMLATMVLPTEDMGAFGKVLNGVLVAVTGISLVMPLLAGAFAAITLPIALVVGAIALVVGGLVLLYKKNETFRNFVNKAWESIKNAVVGAWQNHIWPALQAFGGFITNTVWPAIKSFWDKTKGAFVAIKDAIVGAWKNHIWPAMQAFGGFFTDTLWPAIQTFWGHVKTAFNAIGNFIAGVWNNVIKPPFNALVGFIQNRIVPVLKWLWNNAKVLFGFIGAVIKLVWDTKIKPYFTNIVNWVRKKLVPTFKHLWTKTKEFFSAIGDWIKKTWDKYVRPIFAAIGDWVRTKLVPTLKHLWEQTKSVFKSIGDWIRNTWNNRIKPIFTAIAAVIRDVLAPRFRWFRDKVIKPVWDSIKNTISNTWNRHIKPVFDKIKKAVTEDLPKAFRRGKDAIKDAWGLLKAGLAMPINWVIDNVVNGGLIRPFNRISKMVGAGQMSEASRIRLADGGSALGGNKKRSGAQRYATGGKVRGVSSGPRQDNIEALLTAGEWVQPVDSVKYYGARFMEMVRRKMIPREVTSQFADGGSTSGATPHRSSGTSRNNGTPRFAFGGLIDGIKDGVSGGLQWVGGKIAGVADFLNPGKILPTLVNKALSGLSGISGTLRDTVTGVPKTLATRAVDFLKDKGKAFLDSMSSAGGGNTKMWAPTVLRALSMVGQPSSLLGTTLRRMNQESGGNPRAINLWDSNYLAGIPSKGLMQVIDPTFAAYKYPGYDNIWNPLDNVLASMRYALSRYGSLSSAYNRPGGYADGGMVGGGKTSVQRSGGGRRRYATGGMVGGSRTRMSPGGSAPLRLASGGSVYSPKSSRMAMSPSSAFASGDFRSMRTNTMGATSSIRGGGTFYNGGHDQSTNFDITINNPVAEKSTESIQQRLSRTAALGLIGGRRSDTQ